METAAAILTHLLYTSNTFGDALSLQGILPGNADKMAEAVKPHYQAMLKMVQESNKG